MVAGTDWRGTSPVSTVTSASGSVGVPPAQITSGQIPTGQGTINCSVFLVYLKYQDFRCEVFEGIIILDICSWNFPMTISNSIYNRNMFL